MTDPTPPNSSLNNQTPDSDWYKRRIVGLICFVIPGFAFLLLRLFYLQIIEGDNFRRLSENNCIRLQSIDPPRGLIFDRNGQLLVDNRPSYDLSIVVKDARPLDASLQHLSQYTRIPMELLWDEIEKSHNQPSFKPVLLKQDIGRDVLATIEVKRFDLPGILVDVHLRRLYVKSFSAAHVLGYVGEISSNELKSVKYAENKRGDLIGKSGIEKSFENYLKGERGGRQIEVNVSGQLVRVLKTVDAVPGNNIFLSIDQGLQKKAEDLLSGATGAVVAMDPMTGSVLAMASSPSYDPNMFVDGFSYDQWEALVKDPYHPLQNKAIQAEYPPASTYKIITAMSGLEEGVIDEKTPLVCTGAYKFGDREYRCWKKGGHGSISVGRAIAESCDVFFYQVGLRLGVDRLASYAKAAGFGALTGIQLDQESSGLIPTAAWKKRRTGVAWQAGETLSISIGQGYNLVTPLQLANMISSIANGGTRVTPLMVKKIQNASGETIKEFYPEIRGRLSVSPKNLDIIKKGLWEVVNGKSGTGRIAGIEGVEISGKTGTAQVFSRKTESENESRRAQQLKSHAWFVAYAPSSNPKIAVSVLIEHGEHGASAAAPIARELIRAYLSGQNGN
jgi:penicillin-binding protein 2